MRTAASHKFCYKNMVVVSQRLRLYRKKVPIQLRKQEQQLSRRYKQALTTEMILTLHRPNINSQLAVT
ncbi:uncharacterized protein LOC143149897 isoform X2 [Ptiloglossa arizonensis]|uniref:uncharacterized protein LOC143149897 isoform X2 n=1 Tax=Ptiloglossa arizonensis TaxID=3350558 RepID=UPI003FA157B7